MSAVQSLLSSRKLQKALPWIAGLVLVAGVAVFMVTYFRNTAEPVRQSFESRPAVDLSQTPRSVPVSRDVRLTAAKFIKYAVTRQNLPAAWKISGPEIRQDLTYKEWLTGNIPVVPYPPQAIEIAPFKIDYSYENEVQLQVALLPKKSWQKKIKGQLFFIVLQRVGPADQKRWVVNSWVPRAIIALPPTKD